MTYQVNEVFTSIQGEGLLAGRVSTFIRLQGCSVGCSWCDTRYTWGRGGTEMSAEEIAERVHTSHVVITGGEPTIWDLDDLLAALSFSGRFVQMETSGQHMLKGTLSPNWITWSPKARLHFDADPYYYIHSSEVKFVVDKYLSIQNVLTWHSRWVKHVAGLADVSPPELVFMPEGYPPTDESRQKALELVYEVANNGISAHYSDRLQCILSIR